MKFRVTMKDPDTLGDAIREAVTKQVAAIPGVHENEDEAELLIEKRMEKATDICGQWFEYGEYLTVEIDTVANTATVLENGK